MNAAKVCGGVKNTRQQSASNAETKERTMTAENKPQPEISSPSVESSSSLPLSKHRMSVAELEQKRSELLEWLNYYQRKAEEIRRELWLLQ